jgi:Family of unknown function (DUF6134)
MLSRRAALAGGLAAAALPARAATSASRRFTILRGGSEIGRHDIALTRDGDRLNLAVDVEIVVRILGIAAYRYEMTNREVWSGGLLQSVDCRVNDDGRRKTVRVTRSGGALQVASDFYTGPAPSDAATTTPDFLKRKAWISTDSGEVYAMRIAGAGSGQVATPGGAVEARKWRATNGDDFDVTLSYDGRGEWASVAFDARGEPAVYRPQSLSDSFAALWSAA